MKLVQMPVELLHVGVDDLGELGVDPALLAGYHAHLARMSDGGEGLAILGRRQAGTRELLMVLARRVGAALRDENIRLRDGGGDLRTERKKLCYLPGGVLAEAMATGAARRALEGEAAVFIQELDATWDRGRPPTEALDPTTFLLVLDGRRSRGLPTFISADPAALTAGLDAELRARMPAIEPQSGGAV